MTDAASCKIWFVCFGARDVLSFQALAQTQSKTLDINIQPMLSVCGDSKAIHQLTTLLMDNALKYSPEKSTITIILDKPPRTKYYGSR